MMRKTSTAGIPGLQIEYETRCIECDDHGDCDPGQYCYKYDGTCSDADNQLFICHEESAAKLGTCQDKEDDVFGTPCGTSGCVWLWDGREVPAQRNPCLRQMAGEDANGNGHCGKAIYYNDSYVPIGTYIMPPAGFPRFQLWSGVCVAGKCAECDETDTTNYGERAGVQCINGREVWARDNDWTIRTFTNNTIAGTALTGVVGIALILLCWCCFMVQVQYCCVLSSVVFTLQATAARLVGTLTHSVFAHSQYWCFASLQSHKRKRAVESAYAPTKSAA